MVSKLLILLLLALLYAWVIFSTLPYRKQVINTQDANDYFKLLDWQLQSAQTDYDRNRTSKSSKIEIQDAQERLAMLLWEKRDFFKAITLFEDLDKQFDAEKQSAYSDKWVKNTIRLASLYRDINDWDKSEDAFKSVLAYDIEMLGKNKPTDSRIARDHNNLGLFYYMRATTQTDMSQRRQLMQKAVDELKLAISAYRESNGPETAAEGNSLWNLYLCHRDLGQPKEAFIVRAKAEEIDAKMNRPCKAP